MKRLFELSMYYRSGQYTVAVHYELAKAFGGQGSPLMILEDGTMIVGYLPAKALGNRIENHTGPQ